MISLDPSDLEGNVLPFKKLFSEPDPIHNRFAWELIASNHKDIFDKYHEPIDTLCSTTSIIAKLKFGTLLDDMEEIEI